MEPIVYLPIEIQVRELPSRLLIAAHLLKAGCAVVIGSHWSLVTEANQRLLPPGAYLFKTVNRLQGNAMAGARARGHMAAAIDEEVLIFTDFNGYTIAFSENAADACDLFFAQSPDHKDAVEKRFPQIAGKVKVTGNPRIDLLLPRNRGVFDTADLRTNGYHPYILFNANYGTINSLWNDAQGTVSIAEATGAFEGDRTAKIAEYHAIVEWEKSNFNAMVALLDWAVRNIKGINFVLRPHPGERARHWEKMLAGVPNAHVVQRSDPHPWIMAAKLVVHTGCTTGLEAALLGRPVANLQPENHPTNASILTEVNPTFRSWQAAAQAITAFFTEKSGPIMNHEAQAAAALQRHLPSYRDNTAAALIAANLVEALQRRGAVLRQGFTLTLPAPLAEKAPNEMRKQKYDASEGDMREGLAKAAQLAGLTAPLAFTALGADLFLVAPHAR